METNAAERPRRWSKNTVVLVVSSLFVAVAALVIGVVGVTRSVSFVLHGVDAAADASQIAPDRVTVTDNVVPPGRAAATPAASSPVLESLPASAGSSAQASAPTPTLGASSGGANGTLDSNSATAQAGGVAEQAGTGGAGGTDSTAAAAGTAGAAATFWESTLQSALTLLHQTTISMCGRNTCNVGQVCCNPSCGICTAPGATCDQTQCPDAARTPTAVLCGRGQCNDGQLCCNASCGICAAPGATCSQRECR